MNTQAASDHACLIWVHPSLFTMFLHGYSLRQKQKTSPRVGTETGASAIAETLTEPGLVSGGQVTTGSLLSHDRFYTHRVRLIARIYLVCAAFFRMADSAHSCLRKALPQQGLQQPEGAT